MTTLSLKNASMSFAELQAYTDETRREAKRLGVAVAVWVSGDEVKVRGTDDALGALFERVPRDHEEQADPTETLRRV